MWKNAKAESLLIVLIFGSRISQEAFEEFVSGIDKPFFRLEEHLRGVFAFVLLWWWRGPFLPDRTRCSCWFRCILRVRRTQRMRRSFGYSFLERSKT